MLIACCASCGAHAFAAACSHAVVLRLLNIQHDSNHGKEQPDRFAAGEAYLRASLTCAALHVTMLAPCSHACTRRKGSSTAWSSQYTMKAVGLLKHDGIQDYRKVSLELLSAAIGELGRQEPCMRADSKR